MKIYKQYFGKKLGCSVDVLLLTQRKYSEIELKNKVKKADIIYVGGGDTLKMLKSWRSSGLNKILFNAYKEGKIISGLSAGAICWFKYGNSDSRKFNNKKAELIKVKGLGFENLSLCPHYDVEKDRERNFKIMMSKTPGVGVALENCSALIIKDGLYKIITSNKQASAYKVFWNRGIYKKIKLEISKSFKPISLLVSK